jgi:transcriptional antiterminator RfaH
MSESEDKTARSWHAVFCKPRQDERAEENLLNQGFEVFRPKSQHRALRRGRKVIITESLFPRYLFVHLHHGIEDWSPIRSTFGVVGLVKIGQKAPIVPDPVIQSLRLRCNDFGVIDLAGAIDFQTNDPIEIIDGPCSGYRAIFKERSSDKRVIVLLKLLSSERHVELPEQFIRKA